MVVLFACRPERREEKEGRVVEAVARVGGGITQLRSTREANAGQDAEHEGDIRRDLDRPPVYK